MQKSEEELAALVEAEHKSYIGEEHSVLLQVYVLAEKLQDVQTKNHAIRAVLDLSDLHSANGIWATPSIDAVNMVYNGTTEASPARRLLVDLFSTIYISSILDLGGDMHKDFRSELGKTLMKLRPLKKGAVENVAKKKGADAYLEKEYDRKVQATATGRSSRQRKVCCGNGFGYQLDTVIQTKRTCQWHWTRGHAHVTLASPTSK